MKKFILLLITPLTLYSQKISYKINDFQVLKDLDYEGKYFGNANTEKCEIHSNTILEFCSGRIRVDGYEILSDENEEEAYWSCYTGSEFSEELLDENGNLKYKFEVIDNNMFFLYDSVWFKKERYNLRVAEISKHLSKKVIDSIYKDLLKAAE
jgi:hypothetical protein